jgi:outer membrane protein OmpA-like peptidoglycan-associated protein
MSRRLRSVSLAALFVPLFFIAIFSTSFAQSESGTSGMVISRYSLTLFKFDDLDPGPINRRILSEYVYEDILPPSHVEVIGYTDLVGIDGHNRDLSQGRADAVASLIRKNVKKYASLTSRGVGETSQIYTNDLPEGRFYNRTVQIIVKTPEKGRKD